MGARLKILIKRQFGGVGHANYRRLPQPQPMFDAVQTQQ
jgi:hypothetical protein